MRLALHVHYRPFSVTSEESLRDSEPSLNGYPSTKGHAGDFMRSECVLVHSHKSIHIVSIGIVILH